MFTFICLKCNKKFGDKHRHKNRKYCSYSCFVKSRIGLKDSEETKRKKSLVRIGIKFSKEHLKNLSISHKGIVSKPRKGKIIICKICGKEFYKPQYRIRDNVRFCSLKCRGISMRGIPPKNPVPKGTRNSIATEFKKGCGGAKNHNWKGGISKTKEYIAFYKRRRKLMQKKVQGFHSLDEWLNLKKEYNYTCPSCHKKEPEIKLTVDHITPISKGGVNNIENIQPLCVSCNSRKCNKTIKYRITRS